MKSVLSEYLGCTGCTAEYTVQTALDVCFRVWPQQHWLAFKCPECNETNHIEVIDGLVRQGYLDGAPGPCFVLTRSVPLDKFKAKWSDEGVVIKNVGLTWTIPTEN